MATQHVKWQYPAVIAINESLSQPVHLNNNTLVGLIVPGEWTPANITFQGSVDGTNWFNLLDADGVELTVIVSLGSPATATWFVFPAGAFHGIEFIRFRSGTRATAVNQVAARTLTAILRGFE